MIFARIKRFWIECSLDPFAYGLVMVAALLVLLLCLPACAGPRVEAVEAERAETVARADDVRAELAEEAVGSPRWDALTSELAALRARLLELEAERAAALAADTRDGITGTLWEVAELVLVGGGVGLGVNRHRSKTRARLEERVCELEARGQDGGS
jgi:hypothetical protein